MNDNERERTGVDLAALPPDTLLTAAEVASVLRVGLNTLANWRVSTRYGKPAGPRFAKLGGSMVRYTAGDLREFIAKGAA